MAENRKYSYWLQSGFFSGLQKVSLILFGLISTIILANKLEKPVMGAWSLFLLITAIIEIIRHSLIKNGVIKYLNSESAGEHGSILSTALLFNILVTFTLGILMVCFAGGIATLTRAHELKTILYIFSAGLIFMIPFSHFEWILNARSLFRGIFWGHFTRQAVSLLLMGSYVFFTDEPEITWLVIFFLAGIAAGTVVMYFFAKPFPGKILFKDSNWISRLWHFGKYVFGTNLFSMIFRSTDQFMVSYFFLPEVVASQGVATRISNLTDTPSQVVSDILFPKSAASYGEEGTVRIKHYYEKSVGASLTFIFPAIAVIMLFPGAMLYVFGGQKYMDAIPYLRLIALTGFFMPFLKQFGTILDSTGKPGINFAVMIIVAAVNAVICWFLIRPYGLPGAGYALLSSYFISFIISQWVLYKLYKTSWISCVKNAFAFYPELFAIVKRKLERQKSA